MRPEDLPALAARIATIRPPHGRHASLRARLAAEEPLLLPGVPDAMTARIAESLGFHACYLTTAGYSNASFGVPDIGLIGLAEVVEQATRLVAATSVPIVADGDNGYGGPLSVMRAVSALERAGASAIQLEDQPIPKRCGHFDGKEVVTAEEMVEKILAARTARQDEGFVIIARTDALAPLGFEEAVRRGRLYRDAGADVVFVEAPQSDEQLRAIPREIPDVPLLVNVVEGGVTPQLPAATLAEYGYQVILYANTALRAMISATTQALGHLRDVGDTHGVVDRIASWKTRQDLVGLDDAFLLEGVLVEQASSLAAGVQGRVASNGAPPVEEVARVSRSGPR